MADTILFFDCEVIQAPVLSTIPTNACLLLVPGRRTPLHMKYKVAFTGQRLIDMLRQPSQETSKQTVGRLKQGMVDRNKIRVGIVFNGQFAEHEISILSARSAGSVPIRARANWCRQDWPMVGTG